MEPVTDRLGLEVLTADECWRLAAETPVGRVAFVDAGEPLIFPVTHGVHHHSIVFRSVPGTKLGAAQMGRSIAFETDHWDAEGRRGWSVLARGTSDTVYEDDDIRAFDSIGLEPWVEAAGAGTWVRIVVQEISGRRIQ